MSSRVNLDNTKPLGAAAQQGIALLQSTLNQFRSILLVFDSAQYGAPADWDALGALLGISAADAQAFYGLWQQAKLAIDVAAVEEILKRSGRG